MTSIVKLSELAEQVKAALNAEGQQSMRELDLLLDQVNGFRANINRALDDLSAALSNSFTARASSLAETIGDEPAAPDVIPLRRAG